MSNNNKEGLTIIKKANDCTIFLLAGFKFKKDYISSVSYLFSIGFKNCYLSKEYLRKKHIYLVFDYKYTKEFIDFYNRIKHSSYLVEIFHRNKEVIFVLEYPVRFKHEYFSFINGKYSHFSKDYKSLFPRYYSHNGNTVQSVVYSILYKDSLLKLNMEKRYNIELSKDDEYYPFWNKELNIFK